ncbi:MAG: hypothetical protein IJS58_05870 [Bacilli bacterium]|nr:hypothetical protein [Bacilli bacterium]
MKKKAIGVIELLLSIILLIITIYQSIVGGNLFIIVSLIFFTEIIIYLLALFNVKCIKIASIIQFFHSPLAMVVLLIAIFLNGEANYSLVTSIGSGVCGILKNIIVLYYFLNFRKEKEAITYGKLFNSLVSSLYIINLFVVCVTKNHITDISVSASSIILIIVNALSTFAVAYFALAFLIAAFSEKVLTFKEKIIAMSQFFMKYRIAFVMSEVFELFTVIVCFINIGKSESYFILFSFYLLIFVVRLVTFLWNRKLEKNEREEEEEIEKINYEKKRKQIEKEKKLNLSRKKNGILLFNSIYFIAASDLLSTTLILMASIKFASTIPAWFFVGFMFPFSIMNIVICVIHRKNARHADNAYIDATSDQSLITSLFSLLAGLSYFLRYISDEEMQRFTWSIMWTVVTTIITIALISSFIKSIRGMKGKRRVQLEYDE